MDISTIKQEFLHSTKNADRSYLAHKIKKDGNLFKELISLTSFLPESSSVVRRLWHLSHDIFYIPKCKVCGKELPFYDGNTGYRTYCSSKCRGKDKDVLEKAKKTNLLKYGVDNPAKSPNIKEKMKQTCLVKYNAEAPFSSGVIKNKIKQTNILRYGVDNPMKNEEVKQKCLNKYMIHFYNSLFNSDRLKNKVKPLFSLEEYLQKGGFKKFTNKYKFQCLVCGNVFEGTLSGGRIPICRKCNPYRINTSQYEVQIVEFLIQSGIPEADIIRNDRTVISPLELDIYLPKHNLAIEFDGLVSHSENLGGKDKYYHLNKTKLCESKGVELIHIFSDEWIYKKDIVKSIILNKLNLIKNKIYAKDCYVEEIKDISIVL